MFNLAIAQEIENQIRSPNGIDIQGERVKPGLSFEGFVALKSSQRGLREKLMLPESIQVRSDYKDEKDFTTNYYFPLVKKITKDEVAKYQSPTAQFEFQAQYYEVGQQAIRKTVVPALALFFSLMGAIAHFAKLIMLLSKPLTERIALLVGKMNKSGNTYQVASTLSFMVWSGVIISFWIVLQGQNNQITGSRLYVSLEQQSIGADPSHFMKFKTNALHVIAVGQARGYPLFEAVRQHILFGLPYGYTKPKIND